MLFESTTSLLRNIVHSLENGGETDWDDHLGFGNQCLYELHQMSHSSSRVNRPDPKARFQLVTPPFERAIRAIPHLKAMMRSIRQKDRAAAVESGRAAIAEMDGIRTVLPSVPLIEKKADKRQPTKRPQKPAVAAHRYKKPETKKRVAAAERKAARTSAASSR